VSAHPPDRGPSLGLAWGFSGLAYTKGRGSESGATSYRRHRYCASQLLTATDIPGEHKKPPARLGRGSLLEAPGGLATASPVTLNRHSASQDDDDQAKHRAISALRTGVTRRLGRWCVPFRKHPGWD